MISDINRKRLEWMRDAKGGQMLSTDLFSTDPDTWNGWGEAVSAAAKAALDEIDRLRTIVDRNIEVLTIISGSPDRLIAAQAANQLTNIGPKVKT